MNEKSRPAGSRVTVLVVVMIGMVLSACGGASQAAPTATPLPPVVTVPPPTSLPTTTPSPTVIVRPVEASSPTPAPTPTSAPVFVSKPSGHVTASGFNCPEPQPRVDVKSAQLNLFVWTDYVPADMLECFEMVYGIKVNRAEFSSNEEMYAKLSQGGSTFDLAQPSDYIIEVMVRTGVLQTLDASRLPNWRNLDPKYAHVPYDATGDHIVPYEAGTESIAYNTDKVKTPIESWTDLWRPEFKNRMVFVDDPRYVIGMALLIAGKDPNTTNPDDLKAIRPKLTQLIRAVKVFDSDSPKDALIAGDVDVGYLWNGDAFLAAKQNPAIQYVYPKEGTFVWQDGFGLVKNAPHPDAAYAWLNYMLQADVFWLMLRDWPYTNPNQAALEYAKNATFTVKDADGNDVTPAELYQAYIASPITNPPPEVIQAAHNIHDVREASPLYDQLWTEVKSGQ